MTHIARDLRIRLRKRKSVFERHRERETIGVNAADQPGCRCRGQPSRYYQGNKSSPSRYADVNLCVHLMLIGPWPVIIME
jgi:hypothetical protein